MVIVKSDDILGYRATSLSGKRRRHSGSETEAAKGTLERPVQHLYPMELASESVKPEANTLNPDAKVFRSKRKAAEEVDE